MMRLTKAEVLLLDVVFRAPSRVSMPLGLDGVMPLQRSLSAKMEEAKAKANGVPVEVELDDEEKVAMQRLFVSFDICSMERTHALIETAASLGAQLFAPPPAVDPPEEE